MGLKKSDPEPIYQAIGREAMSRMIAITVLVFAATWLWSDSVGISLAVSGLLLLIMSGNIQIIIDRVLAPIADNLSVWFTMRSTEKLGETAITDKRNPMWVGYYDNGQPLITNLDDMTSTVIWGVTGAGKTTLLHTLLYEMIAAYTPDELHIVIFDHGKDGSDFSIFNRLPYLHDVPIATNQAQAKDLLHWLEKESSRRTELFRKIPDRYLCNDLERYHKWRKKLHLEDSLPELPYLVAIIEEAQDLTGKKSDVKVLIDLAKKGRSTGVKLIIATQYPNTKTVPSDLRSQLWTRFCGSLASPREYYSVAEITKEFTEGIQLKQGQFYVRLKGYPEWLVMNGIMIPEDELMAYAYERSDNQSAPVQVNEERTLSNLIVWKELGSMAARDVAFMEFLRQYETKPGAADVLLFFQMTERTAYTALSKYWPMREAELSR